MEGWFRLNTSTCSSIIGGITCKSYYISISKSILLSSVLFRCVSIVVSVMLWLQYHTVAVYFIAVIATAVECFSHFGIFLLVNKFSLIE